MANQIVVSAGAKVRNLNGVLTGTTGVVNSLPINAANGIPQLDVNGKILVSQLPNSVMEYQGTWNAATNTPTLVNGTGNQGDVYLCNVAGTVNFGAGPIAFVVGDQVIYSGSIWQRASGATGTVTSVAITESGDSLNITGSPITTSGTINIGFNGTNLQYVNGAGNLTTFPTLITSIGLSMPSAFSVANSPLTANGTIAVTGAGYASQYIRGDGTLADFPSSGGGGSSVSYYLNGGTSQGTIGGTTYYEMSKTADTGTGVDFTKSGDGFIVAFLTDANDPALLNIPAGNWNYEIYASMSANGGTPQMYAELYKYDGTTFTLISTSTNEILYDGVNLNLYTFGMTVPATTLALTDRLAIKLYATNSGGKTTTVHTQDSHLCQVITTFSTGITALNGLTAQVQYFQVGTSGTDFNISSTTATHTFNIPDASASARGLITTGTQTIAGIKTFSNGLNSDYIGVTGDISMDGSFSLKQVAFGTLQSGYTNLSGQTNGLRVGLFGGYNALLNFSTSGSYTYTFPAATGTIALTSNLSSYVPYTGATGDVNLGLYSLTSNSIKVIGDNSTYGGTLSIKQSNVTSLIGVGYTELFGKTNRLGISFGAGSIAYLSNSTLTAERTYTLPDATGTIALVGGSGVGTVTSVAALTIGTSGTDLSSTVANSTTTPVITLNVPTASATNRGALASADWTTFNSKQGTITLTTTGTSGAATFTSNTLNIPNYGSALSGYLPLTGGTLTGALGGTSATFSGTINANSANSQIRIGGATTDAFIGVSTSTLYLTDWATATKGLLINLSTGAATFSSTIQSGIAGSGFSRMNKGTSTQAGYFEIFKGDGSTRLGYMGYDNTNFAFTAENSAAFTFTGGAATFSSSVTAGAAIFTATSLPLKIQSTTNYETSTLGAATGTMGYISANGLYGMYIGIGNSGNTWLQSQRNDGNTSAYNLLLNPQGGNVLIGTTTDNGQKLQVDGEIIASGSGCAIGFKDRTGPNTFVWYATSGTPYFFNTGIGNIASIGASTGVYTALSDINKKKDFEQSTLGLNAILGLKPTLYRMKDENNTDKHLGFIAQEVKEFIPQAFVDNDGFIGLDYQAITATLVNAIKELKAEIDILKNK